MVKYNKTKIAQLLICLLLSLFTWAYVTNMENPIQTKTFNNIPVTIMNSDTLVSKNLAVDSASITNFTVVVEGRYTEIQKVKESDIVATIDVKDLALKEGINTVNISVSSSNNNISIVKEKTSSQVQIYAM